MRDKVLRSKVGVVFTGFGVMFLYLVGVRFTPKPGEECEERGVPGLELIRGEFKRGELKRGELFKDNDFNFGVVEEINGEVVEVDFAGAGAIEWLNRADFKRLERKFSSSFFR
jgi:hypothetical protein